MVYRKRSYPKRKRTYKKRRTMNISRPRMGSKAVYIKRTFRLNTSWTPGTATTNDFWRKYDFTLALMPSASEVTTLFDQYKINGIKCVFRPRYDSFSGNDTTDTTLPGVTNQGGNDMHIIIDPNNDLTPSGTYTVATLNTFLENGGVRTRNGAKPFSVYFRPKVGIDLNGITGAMRKSSWVQTSQTGIPHYGFHVFATDVNMTGNFGNAYDVFVTYYLACRGIR